MTVAEKSPYQERPLSDEELFSYAVELHKLACQSVIAHPSFQEIIHGWWLQEFPLASRDNTREIFLPVGIEGGYNVKRLVTRFSDTILISYFKTPDQITQAGGYVAPLVSVDIKRQVLLGDVMQGANAVMYLGPNQDEQYFNTDRTVEEIRAFLSEMGTH